MSRCALQMSIPMNLWAMVMGPVPVVAGAEPAYGLDDQGPNGLPPTSILTDPKHTGDPRKHPLALAIRNLPSRLRLRRTAVAPLMATPCCTVSWVPAGVYPGLDPGRA